jgi:hypothetical protein
MRLSFLLERGGYLRIAFACLVEPVEIINELRELRWRFTDGVRGL